MLGSLVGGAEALPGNRRRDWGAIPKRMLLARCARAEEALRRAAVEVSIVRPVPACA